MVRCSRPAARSSRGATFGAAGVDPLTFHLLRALGGACVQFPPRARRGACSSAVGPERKGGSVERAGNRAAGATSADRAREGAWTSGVLLVVSALLAGGAWSTSTAGSPLPHRARPASAPHRAPANTPVATGAVPALGRGVPQRIRIASLAVDAPLIGLHLAADGSLQPPPASEGNLAGWYAEGTSPGEVGTAVVTGHVDTARGPATFFRLVELEPGAEIAVERADRTVVRFAVDSVVAYPRSTFPSDLVYSPAPRPELRVITCGGPYDRARGGYQDNVVVSAHLDSVTPAAAGGS
ncbi:class F sortase [Kitasatospora sp. NPDC048365]|uniref:class F sortase n=1 Tax=Kitasatospora sp. NPDC048365 TaxID=3364050 RepID=UPI003712AABF